MGDFNSAPNPPPNVLHPSWYALTPSQPTQPQHVRPRTQNAPHPTSLPVPPAPSKEDFLIIGLFALRLTRQLIASLPHYTGQDHDLTWLDAFLLPFDPAYDLAKITGGDREEFLTTYPKVLSHMKRQDRFPTIFMAMNPTVPPKRTVWARQGGMTDADRKEIIDFVDAATEWGSMVLVPREEGESILKMADRRLVADLDAGRGGVDSRSRACKDPVAIRDPQPRMGGGERFANIRDEYTSRRY